MAVQRDDWWVEDWLILDEPVDVSGLKEEEEEDLERLRREHGEWLNAEGIARLDGIERHICDTRGPSTAEYSTPYTLLPGPSAVPGVVASFAPGRADLYE